MPVSDLIREMAQKLRTVAALANGWGFCSSPHVQLELQLQVIGWSPLATMDICTHTYIPITETFKHSRPR